jgi:hypothetical protein
MTSKEYTDKQMAECRAGWFKEHKATSLVDLRNDKCCEHDHNSDGDCHQHPTGVPVVRVINWQKPGSWTYGCRFIIHRRWLTIVGDIGEAVFEWSQDLTLEFLGSLDFGYFMSKCQSSPTGKKFNDWDNHVAWAELCAHRCELKINFDRSDRWQKEMDLLEELHEYSCKEDYNRVAQELYDETGDAETAGMVTDFGVVPSVHAIGMFVGLQMAIAQLKGSA